MLMIEEVFEEVRQVEIVPLTETERSYLVNVVAHDESIWKSPEIYDGMRKKISNARTIYVTT
jgi:hypothetical protein